ncbi:bifunctional DNA-formamidopyrimidine glycosylase/DNA-(apurinic or apyrimidinic site) lyase [Oceanospirillum linum]|uniref:Formamidopyrimidine-DNA glycosylase n=1 Tax=Oceanospirillum linum TaxID=966 RepID=A0A1T1H8K5_OCELI|nr:bifunctional DNA-formamidopyrimidine glycosylase/DNA-(apurinic or apyrimidinic site) lyase [Oceanospirillum linum]OOV86172.1 DNA-formamidopyrimidine glycosylase [Oceanospirillum linum]SEG38893.1 DNA-(apurinic or apyrimidinic site) lyase [Oleiphilus messinensis]SMP31847.1 DNA-(apurinic or apyrimidinic site) lyase [Oceanospirillum linum]
MPELPEVETTRKGVSPYCLKQRVKQLIVRQPSLRWPIPGDLSAQICGQQINKVERRGKYLLFHFDHGTLIMHLGMSGSLRVLLANSGGEAVNKHDHVDIIMESGNILRYHDPRRFGAILWTDQPVEEHKLIAHLGPEPLSDPFNADYLTQRCTKRKTAIKSLIMDSKVVVGVGNIYANEALFLSGIHPQQAAGSLKPEQLAKLTHNIRKVLQHSIEQGGTTLKDFVGGDGKPGYFAQQLNVYGRAGSECLHCKTELKEIRQSNRSSVFCPQCQPL